ncbi:MAG: [FeFe] hydrogenase H-cluster radical SAM maturase HydE [Bacteroidales bacterium]|nr:[FeFe] hydrogenase H-cluster radical SAM maturase HydE [Bacteroidales bacterium]
MQSIRNIILKSHYDREDLVHLLQLRDPEKAELLEHASGIRKKYAGDQIYFRGLIEFSNICRKNCLYCGIRSAHKGLKRYNLNDEEVLETARYALDCNYGSIVLQSGELESKHFTGRVNGLLNKIHQHTGGRLRITLSCGEQNRETCLRWFESGAHRYLLRIEASNPELYGRLHPGDQKHLYSRRLECLYDLKDIGYQTGTGVMIGLPFQTIADLADDLLFMKQYDVDMVGMGPYLEHENTPFYHLRNLLPGHFERFQLTLKMIALLRIMMKDINIAATTATQTIDPSGRELAVDAGANVIMPNITPVKYRQYYSLYNGKPFINETFPDLEQSSDFPGIKLNNQIAYGEWGDSIHYLKKQGS